MSTLRKVKQDFVAITGEFAGTFMFLLTAFMGTQFANTVGSSGGTEPTLYISLVFGMSLLVNAWVFFRISGGLFNPAVSLAMIMIGAVKPIRGILAIVSEIVAAIAASAVVKGLLPDHPTLLSQVRLVENMTVSQGLFLEMFLTAQLVLTILMLAAEKHKATFIAPVGIGLSLFVGELASVYYTGGALNPARAFGPCVVEKHFPGYHWLYWVGPFLGSLVATLFYWMNKELDYEEANPGQDKSHDPEANPSARASPLHSQSVSGRTSHAQDRQGGQEMQQKPLEQYQQQQPQQQQQYQKPQQQQQYNYIPSGPRSSSQRTSQDRVHPVHRSSSSESQRRQRVSRHQIMSGRM